MVVGRSRLTKEQEHELDPGRTTALADVQPLPVYKYCPNHSKKAVPYSVARGDEGGSQSDPPNVDLVDWISHQLDSS